MAREQTVLIIDDSDLVRKLIPVRLKQLGVRILCADGGKSGLDIARKEKVDLILLDVNMPDMDGFEVCKTLKDDRDTHDIPVIFLTGSEDSSLKVRGFEMGAVDYVTKPPDAAELCARVRTALNTRLLIEMLAEQAHLDALTGLHNRGHFDKRMDEEVSLGARHQHPTGLVMVDIDHFKSINDNHGHPVGDEVLRRLGDTLGKTCRKYDIACRYGGEEFAVILRESDDEHSFDCGVRVHQAVLADARLQSILDRSITVSVGTASTASMDNVLPAKLVEAADKSLYRAKQAGRNRVCSSDDRTSTNEDAAAA